MLKTVKKDVVQIDGEGLQSLLGEPVLLMCANYHYVGVLVGVNDTCVLLEEPSIVYETGEWGDTTWKDSQSLGVPEAYVMVAAIESFFQVKK